MYVGANGSGDRDKWYKYNYGEKSEGWLKSIGNDIYSTPHFRDQKGGLLS
jgi:hypothetical protein